MRLLLLSIASCCLWAATSLIAQDSAPYVPHIEARTPEVEKAHEAFRVPENMRVDLIAAEPELANPVAFCIDEQGRFYVCETYRQSAGIEDNRSHMYWLLDDLKAQTVEDRREYILKHHGDKIEHYTRHHDRIRLLTDTTGDGILDQATVFVTGFNDVVDGTGAGVLAIDGDVYYTCIPKLWKFRDTDGDGVADESRVLHDGFGVRFAFRGHDMHGLALGPDGRIYFSIGDRGYHIVTPEGRVFHRPQTGAVFRCERDGSNLEEFAYGLRNPQELAFDDLGNLFTGDNNSDSGDKARWVHICEGGDSGWRMEFQYLQDRGPWNRERIWFPYRSDPETTLKQPAYIVPPIANISDGPSGLVSYYGVGLPERYQGHFFLADFRGQSANSGIRSFANKARGAGFELTDAHEFLWKTLVTDVDFGYDGRIYFTDWVNGWTGEGRGRIYRCQSADPELRAAGDAVAALFQVGFKNRSIDELTDLLAHPDRRVRQRAQFELAARNAAPQLTQLALTADAQPVRLHALWGLWQIGRTVDSEAKTTLLEPLLPLLDDTDPEMQAQASQVLGDLQFAPAAHGLLSLLSHKSSRVRYFAAISLGKLRSVAAIEPLLNMLAENQDEDPILRHAGVMGLTGAGQRELTTGSLSTLSQQQHGSRSARLGLLLALRRLQSPEVARFLTDGDLDLVTEAARAINDEPILAAYPALAALPVTASQSQALQTRILQANFVLGQAENLQKVLQTAADASLPESLRLEAVNMLLSWEAPGPLDRVTNRYRGLAPRQIPEFNNFVQPYLGSLMNSPEAVQTKVVELAGQLGISDIAPVLRALLFDNTRETRLRVSALQAWNQMAAEAARQEIPQLLTAEQPELRIAARNILIQQDPATALNLLTAALQTGTVLEQQAAIAQLAERKDQPAAELLLAWFNKLAANNVPAEIQLDLLLAAKKSDHPSLQQAVANYEARREPQDQLAPFRETLAGGDALRGAEIFSGNATASCRRCHEVNGQGGGVGPDLSEIGKTKDRPYLLAAIVHPDAEIAKGFETVTVVTIDGKVVSGIVREETASELLLVQPLGDIVRIPLDDIEDRAPGKSGMPADFGKHLSLEEIRDLVEYLTTLQQKDSAAAHGHQP